MDKRKILQDLVCAGFFLILSMFLIFVAIPSQISVGGGFVAAEAGANSRTFPYFAVGMMGIAAVGELIISIFQYIHVKKEGQRATTEGGNEIRALIIFGLCLIYAWLFHAVGFLISTFLVMPFALFIMGSRKWKHYLSVYMVAIVMYFIFQYVLNVQLP